MSDIFIGLPPRLRNNCADIYYNNIVNRAKVSRGEHERYDRRQKRRHKRDKVADAPILAIIARKPPKGGKSRADAKSALSVRKHGGLCRVSENTDKSTMLVRGKFPLIPLNKKDR